MKNKRIKKPDVKKKKIKNGYAKMNKALFYFLYIFVSSCFMVECSNNNFGYIKINMSFAAASANSGSALLHV